MQFSRNKCKDRLTWAGSRSMTENNVGSCSATKSLVLEKNEGGIIVFQYVSSSCEDERINLITISQII